MPNDADVLAGLRAEREAAVSRGDDKQVAAIDASISFYTPPIIDVVPDKPAEPEPAAPVAG